MADPDESYMKTVYPRTYGEHIRYGE
ncbi:hypothetical protein XBJ2_1900011 [Xenorhabdus bovienii str. Jollieti]|uniref:Uncharacterized protein n=1 Tax=Xenorhabdus bovienii (strain SS-2004) TaxID=406818 RepID=D3V5E7_XENBS|nr:hypothetical protein XBJ1_3758 [Xenorhabdus bovienii SS-2004]CDH28648.1 hypothetical protein XBJ2_1900011 [Xenorhabdus bovienii str. Jollieti]